MQAACQIEWLRDVILDFLEVHGLKEAVALVKQSGKTCTVCTPRCALTYCPLYDRLSTWKPLPIDTHSCTLREGVSSGRVGGAASRHLHMCDWTTLTITCTRA